MNMKEKEKVLFVPIRMSFRIVVSLFMIIGLCYYYTGLLYFYPK